MILLGLTGGMGCGKSTAARFFAEHGFGSIDADEVVHRLLSSDEEVIAAIREKFGEDFVDPERGVDRRKVGARVFGEQADLEWLEALLHPRVGQLWRAEVAQAPGRDWVVQIPLLFEKKLEEFFHFTVCVGASGETQQRRLLQRGLSAEEIARRVSRQLPIEEKTARADFYLSNDGAIEFLHLQVAHLCRHLRPLPPPPIS